MSHGLWQISKFHAQSEYIYAFARSIELEVSLIQSCISVVVCVYCVLCVVGLHTEPQDGLQGLDFIYAEIAQFVPTFYPLFSFAFHLHVMDVLFFAVDSLYLFRRA